MTQLWAVFKEVLFFFILILPLVLVGGYILYRSRRRNNLSHTNHLIGVITDILFILSILGILMVTILPIRLGISSTVQLVPFVDSIKVLFHSVDFSVPIRILGFNILLFVPFGFFLAWRSKHKRKLLISTIFGAALSVFVETVQFLLPIGRVTNIDDVFLNLFGSFIGASFYLVVRIAIPKVFGGSPIGEKDIPFTLS